MNHLQRLAAVFLISVSSGGAFAFDPAEQASIDALQQQVVNLQTQLSALQGNALPLEDVVAIAWAVVAALIAGGTVKIIRSYI